jgi:hypothetical protein
MRCLKVPEIFAGAGIESKQAIGKEIGADAVRSVEIIGGRAQGEIGDSALLIDRDLAPRIGAAYVLPGIRGPCVLALFARMRNRVEYPHHLSGKHVIGAQVAWWRIVVLSSS